MRPRWISLAMAALGLAWAPIALAQSAPADQAAPPVMREFRGVWVASVRNIDWPSKPGLSVAQQQSELRALLDKTLSLRMNAVVLQIRPACDAFYPSTLEPWSEYLTGTMGQAPVPAYDPLAFAVDEAHKRGLELHAWFNPYRARLLPDDGSAPPAASPQHISRRRPDLVRRYGKFLWLDPGEPEVQAHSLAVMLDVVKRYDIDAVHMDDYFYPYREARKGPDGKPALDAAGKPLYQPFPDEQSFGRYRASGGTLARDDWRRDNVNRFVERLYKGIKTTKPQVKLGISPFGIWKPGQPGQIKGMNQYEAIYADARLWFQAGWLDYFTPQLYWSIENPDQSYPVLLAWWAEQNALKRHLWPGLFTSRIADGSANPWVPQQLAYQVLWTRLQPGATGHVHFSMKAFLENRGGVSDVLGTQVYAEQALVPPTQWLDALAPERPTLRFSRDTVRQRIDVSWQGSAHEAAWLWTVARRRAGVWRTEILPGATRSFSIDLAAPDAPDAIEVGAVDRSGNESARVRAEFLPAAR